MGLATGKNPLRWWIWKGSRSGVWYVSPPVGDSIRFNSGAEALAAFARGGRDA